MTGLGASRGRNRVAGNQDGSFMKVGTRTNFPFNAVSYYIKIVFPFNHWRIQGLCLC
ncbi:hypothetical protein NITGR_730005 [Nitrospina gracilis 3/211]|uniref:Uncharacterized protein n=1 Tax=Nitrospina gracilis (strain 3/211) TaxID=1266370 RepID=M1YM34_NITG3|nr:hypothetical protein NITGR_730005 [Nitrospina gracilis 3/211]